MHCHKRLDKEINNKEEVFLEVDTAINELEEVKYKRDEISVLSFTNLIFLLLLSLLGICLL